MSLSPQVLVLRAPGTNCDLETVRAFELAGARVRREHVNRVLDCPSLLQDSQILCIPGGFSYGDDIGAGRILATQLSRKLGDSIREFFEAGKLVLGICNGFQVLVKAGLLFPPDDQGLPATLTWNTSGRFIDCWVDLEVASEHCVFLRDVQSMYLPIAHAEGRFVARSDEYLEKWSKRGQLAMRYHVNGHAIQTPPGPGNPNGSARDVAGACDESGRIFGLMPHPERFVDPFQHPHWTRLPEQKVGDGLAIFQNAVDYFA